MAANVSKASVNELGSVTARFQGNRHKEAALLLVANIAYWMLAGAYHRFSVRISPP